MQPSFDVLVLSATQSFFWCDLGSPKIVLNHIGSDDDDDESNVLIVDFA